LGIRCLSREIGLVLGGFKKKMLKPESLVDEYVNVDSHTIALVIPTLNEESGLFKVLDQISYALSGYRYQVVVVDGHSTDRTVEIARERGVGVIFQRNKGYGDALLTGFQYVNECLGIDIIVMLDADLSYDPCDIPRLLEPILEDETDYVIGNRFEGLRKGAMPLLNRIGNQLLSRFADLALEIGVSDTQCGIRAFRSELLNEIDTVSEGMSFAIEMLVKAKFVGARIVEVPVNYRRRVGNTKLNPIRDGMRIFWTILRLALSNHRH